MAPKTNTAFQGSGSGRSKLQTLGASGADARGRHFPRGKGVRERLLPEARVTEVTGVQYKIAKLHVLLCIITQWWLMGFPVVVSVLARFKQSQQ